MVTATLTDAQKEAIVRDVEARVERIAAQVISRELIDKIPSDLLDAGMGFSLKKAVRSVVSHVRTGAKSVGTRVKSAVKRTTAFQKRLLAKKLTLQKRLLKKQQQLAKRQLRKQKQLAKRQLQREKKVAKRIGRAAKVGAKRIGRAAKRVVKKVGKPVVKFGKKYGVVIIGVAGAVLAPFTAGISAVVAGLITTAWKIERQRAAAKKIKKAEKRQMYLDAAQVGKQEKELKKQLDSLYDQAPEVFAAGGISKSQWLAMPYKEQVDIIERIQNGTMPATPQAAAAAQASGTALPQGAVPSPSSGGYAVTTSGGSTTLYPGSEGGVPSDEAESEGPVGSYELLVEGKSVGTVSNSADVAKLVAQSVSPGERFEVVVNGQPSGLKIMTSQGAISVPPDQEARVRSMPEGELNEIVKKAEAAKGKKGIPWWGWAAAAAAIPIAIAVSS